MNSKVEFALRILRIKKQCYLNDNVAYNLANGLNPETDALGCIKAVYSAAMDYFKETQEYEKTKDHAYKIFLELNNFENNFKSSYGDTLSTKAADEAENDYYDEDTYVNEDEDEEIYENQVVTIKDTFELEIKLANEALSETITNAIKKYDLAMNTAWESQIAREKKRNRRVDTDYYGTCPACQNRRPCGCNWANDNY